MLTWTGNSSSQNFSLVGYEDREGVISDFGFVDKYGDATDTTKGSDRIYINSTDESELQKFTLSGNDVVYNGKLTLQGGQSSSGDIYLLAGTDYYSSNLYKATSNGLVSADTANPVGINDGNDVIKNLLAYLDKTSLTGEAALDAAVQYCSDFASWQDLVNSFIADCASYNGDARKFLQDKCSIRLYNEDTGAISGYDAGSGVVKTAESIVPEDTSTFVYPSSTTSTFDGLTVKWPTKSSLTSAQQTIVAGLNTWWIPQALKLIKDSYGLSFSGSNPSVKTLTVNFETTSNDYLATAGYSTINGNAISLTLNINNRYYTNVSDTDPNGVSSDTSGYLDRTIAHELTHSIMEATIHYFSKLPNYFVEGMAELTHGIDDERTARITALASDSSTLASVIEGDVYGDTNIYAAGYMLLRYLAFQASDAAATGSTVSGGTGSTVSGATGSTISGGASTVSGGTGSTVSGGTGKGSTTSGGTGSATSVVTITEVNADTVIAGSGARDMTVVRLLSSGSLNMVDMGSADTLLVGTVTGGSLLADVTSGTGNVITIGNILSGNSTIKAATGTAVKVTATLGDAKLSLTSEDGDYVNLASGSKLSSLTQKYSGSVLSLNASTPQTIVATSAAGSVEFGSGSALKLSIGKINPNVDSDGDSVTSGTLANNVHDVLGIYEDTISIGTIAGTGQFKVADTVATRLILENGTSFKNAVFSTGGSGMININAASASEKISLAGTVTFGEGASVVGSYWGDYIELGSASSASSSKIIGGAGNDSYDFSRYTSGGATVMDFGFVTDKGVAVNSYNGADVIVLNGDSDTELAKIKLSSGNVVYNDIVTLKGSTGSEDYYFINVATGSNLTDVYTYRVTASGLSNAGADTISADTISADTLVGTTGAAGTVLTSTGKTPVKLVAGGAKVTLDGGTNGTDDALISAGSGNNTTFFLHKNGGNDMVRGFVFGGDKTTDDVIALDGSFDNNGLITPSSGMVRIGFDALGSMTLTGETGQNKFAYNYGGNLGVVNVDMSSGGMDMTFDDEANYYIGQGKKTSLVFTKDDFIAGTGSNGVFSGFGWNSPYISEGLGIIDARDGDIAAVNGDNAVAQIIYASTVVGGASSKAGDNVYLCGGLGENFSNSTADTLVGSANGNTTFYVGGKMGDDVLTNAVGGDMVVFIDTKYSDLASFTGTAKTFNATFTNGTTVKLTAAENITSTDSITVQFDDATYKWNGSYLSQKQ